LKVSNIDWEDFFKAINHPALILDPSNRILAANNASQEYMGLSENEIVGKQCFKLIHGADSEKCPYCCPLDKLKKGINETIEMEMEAFGGYALVSCTPIFNANGDLDKIIHIATDITRLKKTEQELEKSENKYRTIFENSVTAILTFKNDGTIVMINSEWERLSGYSRQEVEGKMTWMELVHPDYLEKMTEYHLQRVKDPDSVPPKYDIVFTTKSGDMRVMQLNITALPETDMWITSAIDITDLTNTQKQLEKNVLRFRALAEYAMDGIITTDAHGKILYFNNSLLKMFGYTKDELQNSKLTKLMPERYRKNFIETLKKFRSTGEHNLVGRFIETTGLKSDGKEFFFEMSLTKWETDEKIYFTSIIRDITERKKDRDALKKSEAYYRTIFTHSRAATVIIEEDTTISLANPEFEKLSGYSVNEIEGKIKWTDFVFEGDLERMKGYHRQRRIDPSLAPENYEFRFINRQGDFRDIVLIVAVIPGTKKSVASLLDTTELKRTNYYLKWELNVNEALNKIYEPLVSPKSTIEEIAHLILSQSLELTDSEYGFICEIKARTNDMSLLSIISPMPLEKPQKPILKLEEDGIYGGLMGHSLNIKTGFFTNDSTSHPSYIKQDGHLHIKKFLSVPVMLKNELVGQISLANSSRDYTEYDLDAIKRLVHFYSLALQKIRDRNKIKSSLDEKEVLLREVHHRVKNNMQIISSLLNLQIQLEDHTESENVLKESQGRIKAMAMVHEKLYQSDNFSKINFKDYLTNLVSDIFYSYGIRGKIMWELDIDDINIGIDTAIPLGLIINELVTNSVKYAFPGDRKGIIKIIFKLEDDKNVLIISDDGVGIPADLEVEKTKTLGLLLVNSLVDQLDGSIELDRNQGTSYKIYFQNVEYPERV
jgi:PAS domain S-box-containing protein